MEFERLQNLEAVGEEVSILVFQISTIYVTHSLDENTGYYRLACTDAYCTIIKAAA